MASHVKKITREIVVDKTAQDEDDNKSVFPVTQCVLNSVARSVQK